jgi:hypothetical protein
MKILIPTFEFLAQLTEPATVTLRSTYPSLEGVTASFERGQRNFLLEIPRLKTYQGMDKDYDDSYGLFKPFKMEKAGFIIETSRGSDNLIFDFNGFSAKCNLPEFESHIDHSSKQHYRLILPRAFNNNKDPYEFISSDQLVTDNGSSSFAGLIRFTAKDHNLELFNCDQEENWYLAIDSISPIGFEQFKTIINAVIFSLGFVTGELHRNEMFILQSATADFKIISGCYFERMKDTVSSGMEIVSPRLWELKANKKPLDSYLDQRSFSNLITSALKDHRLLRALQIITEGNAYPFEIRASVYSVALETVKNIVIEDNQEKLNPFKSKAFASKTIKQLVGLVNELDEQQFNSKSVVISKLQQLNQITNKDSFINAFKVYNFNLNESDKEALNKRNDFLHGRIPFEDEDDAELELKFVTFKMHYLVSILILKHVGFAGWIRNTPLFFAALSKKPNLPDEAPFVK